VQEGLNNLIQSLRTKLLHEKEEIDSVLDPLQQQLADLNPVVTAMPAAEQDLARMIRQRLDALNAARSKYAKTVGEDEQLPASPKVIDLQTQITDLKTRLVSRQAQLSQNVAAQVQAQRNGDLGVAQNHLAADQKTLDSATQQYSAALTAFQDAETRRNAAVAAQQKKINLMDDQRVAFTDLESAKRDRDDKQAAAEHAFGLEPLSDASVTVIAPTDPRIVYMAGTAGAGLVLIALLAVVSHHAGRKAHKQHALMPDDFDSLVIPMAGHDQSADLRDSDLE
jgi:predicted ribonuclease YlaK